MCKMQNIMILFVTLIHSDAFDGSKHNESHSSILSKFSHRRGTRELNNDDLHGVLELADLSGGIPNPCNNGGTLLHNVMKKTYVCQCSEDYEGRHCEIKTRVCTEEENACKFYESSSVTCECRPVQGSGFVCHHYPPQYRESWCRSTEHTNKNTTICPENWTCLNHILGKNQGYRCLPPGHITPPIIHGRRQAGVPKKCSCHNGGHCNKHGRCICLQHFTGPYCESQINYCKSNPCPSNINCEPVFGGYRCNCPVLRGGLNCEETRRFVIPTMVSPRFNYHASQHTSVPSTCLFYVEEIGILPQVIIDFGDGTSVTMFKEDFHLTDKLNDILISYLYQPINRKGTVYLVNYTHAYEAEGLYNISVAAWNMGYVTMKGNFTVLVSSPARCEFAVKLSNAAATPDNVTIYQRRHSINIHSVSTVTCPGTRLKYLWELFAVPNVFAPHTPEMLRRSPPSILTQISEYHIPPYTLPFEDFLVRLTVEMLQPARVGNKTVMTWFKIVKDKIVAHISGGNIQQVHRSESFVIDASESYDPNFPFTTMSFEWTCSVARFEDMVPGFCDNELSVILNEPVLNVQQNVLKLNGLYIFTVKVESIDHDISQQSVQVQVVSEDTELVHIECVQNCLGNKVITTSPMALRATSPNNNDSMKYIWALSYHGDASVSTETETGYYSDGNNFVTKPGSLLPARSYQVSVKVENQNNSIKRAGRAIIVLATYPALTIGFCIVIPSQGYALLTRFQIQCYRFVADYLPVTYEVFQYRLPKEEPIMMGFGVSPEFFNITLAAGLPENEYSTALRVYASDSKGNFGFYEQDITVYPAAVYTNLNDELAIVKGLTLGTSSAIVTNLVNQEVQSVIQIILSAACSVHTFSQQLRRTNRFRRSRVFGRGIILRDQINTIMNFKDTMVEYLSHCELRSPIIAKYCSSTLTSILECDYNVGLTNGTSVPYANAKAVNVLDNIVEMLHKITQQSEDTTTIRTDVLDIGTTILSSVSLLLKEPKGDGDQTLMSRRLSKWWRQANIETNEGMLDSAQQENRLARQTEAVINSMNNYASLFARYMAPHEDDYLTNPTEDICISIQKTNRGMKMATLPAYVEVNVSILSDDSNAMYDLQVITMKNNPYWWEESAKDMNFPLIKVDVFTTIKELRRRIARVGASRKHEIRKSLELVTYAADLKFLIPQENSHESHQVIKDSVPLKPTWNYTDSDISIHKLEFRSGGKTFLTFDDQGDNVVLRVVVKENAQPDLNDFWESVAIPKFEETNLSERQKRTIFLDAKNNTEKYVSYYIGILPHQATIRSVLHDIDPPIPDSFLYEAPPPKPTKLQASGSVAYSFKAYNAQCLRWNSSKRSWANHCRVLESDLTEMTISCHCDGLSTIGASFRAADTVKNTSSKFSQFIRIIDNSLIFWFLVWMTLCFLGLFAWGGMWDRRDKKRDKLIFLNDNKTDDTYCYVILMQTGKNLDPSISSKVAVILEGSKGNSSVHVLHSLRRQVMLTGTTDYFILRTPQSLGDVFCLHLWHNHKGSGPIWYIEKIIVHDAQTHHVSVFIFETWLTPLHEDGHMSLSCYRMLNNEVLPWKVRLSNAMTDVTAAGYHCWLGMCSRQLSQSNTRRRRVVLAFVHVCVLMASITAFYPLPTYGTATEKVDTSDEFSFAWEEVIIGIVAASLAFLVNCIFFCIAKNVAPAQSYTTDYSSRFVEELVISMPANPDMVAPDISSDKKILLAKEVQVTNLYTPGQNQVIGKRTVPLRVPHAQSQRIFYDEVISQMGPIQATQRIRFAYVLSHIFLYPLWVLLGVVLLMALYFILFYATFYAWTMGLRYLFATGIGFLFSFAILEPLKVMVCALVNTTRQKGVLVIDDRSRIALYVTRDFDTIQLENDRTAAIYKPPIV